MKIVDPATSPHRDIYAQELFRLRQRRGVTLKEAETLLNNRNVFGSMMVHMGDADALVSGVTQHFPDRLRPALQIVRMREGLHRVSGCYPVITRKGEVFFLADTSVNIEPTAEDMVEIALCTAPMARRFDLSPRVALLSFSSFGIVDHPICRKVRRAVELIKYADPTLIVDGGIAADEALSPETIEELYPFSSLKGGANVLIFPDLASANSACKLAIKVGGGELIGPILMGMSRPVHVLQRTATVEAIVNVAAIAVVDAQENDTRRPPNPRFGRTGTHWRRLTWAGLCRNFRKLETLNHSVILNLQSLLHRAGQIYEKRHEENSACPLSGTRDTRTVLLESRVLRSGSC
jgi:malate dehydrogenase (oxaloacetate-decarboxylating)(NADP+)